MKRFVSMALSVMVLIGTGSVKAADNYLHVRTSQGWEVLNLDKVDRLYFNNNVMTVTDASQNVISSFSKADLISMYVDDTSTTAVKSIAAEEKDEAPYRYDSSASNIYMKGTGEIVVYNLGGEVLVNIPEVKAGEVVDIKAIAPGAIIIRSGNYTSKAIKK